MFVFFIVHLWGKTSKEKQQHFISTTKPDIELHPLHRRSIPAGDGCPALFLVSPTYLVEMQVAGFGLVHKKTLKGSNTLSPNLLFLFFFVSQVLMILNI